MRHRDVALVAIIGHECSITVGALQSVPGVPSHMVHVVYFDHETFVTLLAVVLILALMLVHVVCVAITRAELFLTDMTLEVDSSSWIRVHLVWHSIWICWQYSSLCTPQDSLKQKTSWL